jgi:two-component system, LytTR family, response regulator
MAKIKVGIVEDEMIIALGISDALTELGYEVTKPANNYTQALEMIAEEKPDILLLDIQLSGHKDGIDLALKIKKDFQIPFIFLTANADIATVERAKAASAHAYLVKPFRKNELYTSIEICLHNYAQNAQEQKMPEEGNYIIKDSIFIKQGQFFHKVKIDDIIYLESDNNYLNVHTRYNKMLVRSTVNDYLDLIGLKHFFRVHRSYAVNIHHIQSINSEYLLINEKQIPIGKAYRDQLLGYLKLG